MEHNQLPDEGGVDSLVDRISDGVVYGKATCAVCPNNNDCNLLYSSSQGLYKCKTDTQWGKCGWEGNDVKIHPFSFPPGLHLSSLRDTGKIFERQITKVSKQKLEIYERDHKRPLRDMIFSLSGRLNRSHAELASLIIDNGGKISDINPRVDYVISTFNNLEANPPKIQTAKTLGLAIVTELIITRLIEEFGFDQEPYLLDGNLPPIAFSKLKEDTEGDMESNEEIVSTLGKIDPSFPYPNANIHTEHEDVYDTLLILTDINRGHNSFYKMQILKNKNSFYLFRKWGRVGTTIGGNTVNGPTDFYEVYQIFKEQYLDKTGNNWDERKKFEKMPGKYFPIQIDQESDDSEEEEENLMPSFLDPRLQVVMKDIFDTSMMTRNMVSLGIDTQRMPLGKISLAQIKNGYSILKDIETLLLSDETGKEFALNTLSNRFFTVIPTSFGRNRVQIIDNVDTLKLKMNQLELLSGISEASNCIQHASQFTSSNPIDSNYQTLQCNIRPLSKYSRDYRNILTYVNNGHSLPIDGFSLRVLDILEVERDNMNILETDLKRKLLWHGSGLCNVVGILSNGLKIAPPEAPKTGHLFGKGIYLSDRVALSASFCRSTEENPIGYLFLCDTVVGDSYEVKKPTYLSDETLPEGKQSTMVLSKYVPDPAEDVEKWGIVIPMGRTIETGLVDVFVESREYIVYTTDKVAIKYLVKVEFSYN
eukprot:TRINITY_DN3719_c0_g1_i5.p1 TRINITY_DN3719_c0_g1~~TRINITY_DN3719_c0_g1_i5.p1  ORF type:complete len:705 (+),score=155.07 TRINITY_DN3719_c0_g1_i5:287-2401(+)